MKTFIPALGALAQVALKPEIGADSQVFVAEGDIYEMGTIVQTGEAANAFTSKLKQGVDLGDGRDLNIFALNPINGGNGGNIEILVDVTFDDDATGAAKATFQVPAWASDQGNHFGKFTATDFVAEDAGNADKLIKGINSVTSVTNGAQGNQFMIVASQPEAEFFQVGCATNKSGKLPTSKQLPIQCGRNAQRYTREGVSEVQELTLDYKYISMAEGIDRLFGRRITVWQKIIKDQGTHTENYVYSGYLAMAGADRGEGDDEVVASSSGPFEMVFRSTAL